MAPVIASSSLLETVEQGIVDPVLQSLSCCSDCVRRLGAFVTYLPIALLSMLGKKSHQHIPGPNT